MCNSYGLGGYLHENETPNDPLPPLDIRKNERAIAEWAKQLGGRAAITGKKSRNLNPLIRAGNTGERSLDFAWWWIWLDARGPVQYPAFNSRDDNLTKSWKKQFQERAILPASWYVEKKGKFSLPGNQQFGIAAVTSTIKQDDGTELVTYSMVTRNSPPGSEAAEYWHRMPLLLPEDIHDTWLDPDRPGNTELVTEVQHTSEEISRQLNTVETAPPPIEALS